MAKKQKKEIVINHHVVADLIAQESQYNWLISKGLQQISDGVTLGRNMEYFLETFKVISYK